MRIAFVGIGQSYPSHLWMQRMRKLLGDRIVVNIDDRRNTERGGILRDDTHYVPRNTSRLTRAMRAVRLTGKSSTQLRNGWMLRTIVESKASMVFVHFLDYATEFNEVWRRLGIPVAVHCHGYDVQWDVRDMINKKRTHSTSFTDRVRTLAENVWFIANSTFTIRQLQQLDINPSKIFLKRFGVPVSAKPRSIAGKEAPSVLYLGRLIDFKGPLETARAFGQIAGKYPGTSLEIAGEGGLAHDLDKLITELKLEPSVNLHGAVSPDRGRELRRRAAVFTAHNQKGVITGQEEAFGVSLLEAMGEGLPVVTGRSGGIPDFIQHRENGLLFEPGDVDAHAGMLDELLSSRQRRESLGLAAWETVRDRFQVQHELDDMIRIFEQINQIGAGPTLSESVGRRVA